MWWRNIFREKHFKRYFTICWGGVKEVCWAMIYRARHRLHLGDGAFFDLKIEFYVYSSRTYNLYNRIRNK